MTKRNIILVIKIGLILPFLLLFSCQEKTTIINGTTMGTSYQIKIIGSTEITKQAIDKELQRFNNIFSTWQQDSELTKINQAPINKWLGASSELLLVLKVAQIIYLQSEGYFDITLGRVSQKLGFQKSVLKNSNQQNYAYGQANLIIKNKKIKKLKNILIDVSALAKGYAVDKITQFIKEKKHNNFLVEIGGEIKASGLNQNNKPWVIGIESATNNKPKKITLTNNAIATSGNYRNYLIKNQIKLSHILNPKTQQSTKNPLISVSVIHSSTMFADAYATAIMAMPLNKIKNFITNFKLNVISNPALK
jgi:thiamine biosynthesis lipoprotein